MEVASDKEEFACRTIRPKIESLKSKYLKAIEPVQGVSNTVDFKKLIDKKVLDELKPIDLATDADIDRTLQETKPDKSVPRLKDFR